MPWTFISIVYGALERFGDETKVNKPELHGFQKFWIYT